MNKKDFLERLGKDIDILPKAEKERLLNYYSEILEDRIEEGMTEEEAVLSLESADNIAKQILADHNAGTLDEKADSGSGKKRNFSKNSRVWLYALTSPFWLMGMAVYLMLLLSVYIVDLAFGIVSAALVFSFGACGIAGLFTLPFVFPESMLHGMLNLSLSILCLGLLLFSIPFCKKSIKALLCFARWITFATKYLFCLFFGIRQAEQPKPNSKAKEEADKKKPFGRRYFAAAAVLTLAGFILLFSQFASVDFNLAALDTRPPLVSSSYDCPLADISEISLETSYYDVKVIPAEGNEIRFQYQENEREGYEIDNFGDTLRLTHVTKKWTDYLFTFNIANLTSDKTSVYLVIPKSYTGTLKVKNSNSNISISGLEQLKNAQIKTSYDEISLTDITVAGSLAAENSNGLIKLNNITSGKNVSCKSSFDDISLENLTVTGSLTVKNSNGLVELNDIRSGETINCKSSYASIQADNVEAAGGIEFQNANGDILLNEITTKDLLSCKTSFSALEGADISAGSMTANGSNSKITFRQLEASGNLDLTASYDTVSLQDGTIAGDININGSNGQIHLDRVVGDKIFCKTSYDDLEFTELSGNDLDLRVSNGSIQGKINGSQKDYRISYQVSSGTSNLPKTETGSKALAAKASYGDIDIDFAD